MADKNPMAHMLGAYLRRERNYLKESSSSIAQKVGNLTDSFYRLIESGHALPQTYRMFSLIKALKKSSIHYDRLSIYLTGAHYVDELMQEGKTPKAAMYELASLNDDFNKFYEQTIDYFSSADDFVLKDLLSSKLANEVANFLSNPAYLSPQDKFIQEGLATQFDEMATLTLQLFLDFMHTFKRHPPLHISDIAQQWEDENQGNFKNVIGFYKDVDLIISPENLSKFNFPYLFKNQFENYRMIFISSQSSKAIKEKFIKGLNEVLIGKKLPTLTATEIDKIQIKTISSSKGYENEINGLVKEDSSIYKDLRAFWQFTMYEGNPIGFVGASRDHVSYVMNLKYRECMDRKKLFEFLWSVAK